MTGQHPFDKLSAAVDGELDHDTRDRVYSHLVGCETCRTEVEEQRRHKNRLGLLDTPEPSAALMSRLLGVPEFGTEPREEVRPVPPVTLRPARPIFAAAPATRSDSRPAARTSNRRRAVVVTAAGSAAAVVSLLGTAFVVGEPAQETPPLLQPPVSAFSRDHATSTGSYPFGDSAAVLTTLNGPGFGGSSMLLQPAADTGR